MDWCKNDKCFYKYYDIIHFVFSSFRQCHFFSAHLLVIFSDIVSFVVAAAAAAVAAVFFFFWSFFLF